MKKYMVTVRYTMNGTRKESPFCGMGETPKEAEAAVVAELAEKGVWEIKVSRVKVQSKQTYEIPTQKPVRGPERLAEKFKIG